MVVINMFRLKGETWNAGILMTLTMWAGRPRFIPGMSHAHPKKSCNQSEKKVIKTMLKDKNTGQTESKIKISKSAEDAILIRFLGRWKTISGIPDSGKIVKILQSKSFVKKVIFDASNLLEWDTSLLTFLLNILDACEKKGIKVVTANLPPGILRLIALAKAVPTKDTGKDEKKEPFVAKVGMKALEVSDNMISVLRFTGELTISFAGIFTGKARFRKDDLILFMQDCGPKALPIVTLISMLVGLILAFVGAIQLELFGAEIYVADLVGLGMAREMGAMMAAIVLSGRTGAAYAAQIGTMQVNEEIDALSTFGIPPMDFLVLPRMLALALMMPLLCLYADFMGILGGAIVSILMLNISPTAYFLQTQGAVPLHHFATGLIKSGVFGIIVAFSGCFHGIKCGRSASAVGDATTSAVVMSIVLIIVFDAIFTVIFNILGI